MDQDGIYAPNHWGLDLSGNLGVNVSWDMELV